MSTCRSRALAILLLLAAAQPVRAVAQELNPRAYWPAPAGTTVLIAGYQYSEGAFVFDPALQVEGARSTVNATQVAAQHTFGILGRTSTLQIALPVTWGATDGLVAGEYRRRDLAGVADVRTRLAVNLTGAPTMTRPQFRQLLADPGTIVGASLTVTAPTGRYQDDRFLNIGTNRWSFKPALGVIEPLGDGWALEAEIGVWLFTVNDDFVGRTRSQAPLLNAEMHLVKVFRSGWWLALDTNYYAGGRSTVDGVASFDLQRNSRLGATVTYPFGARRRHALRASFGTGIFTTRGGDFDSVGVAYLHVLP